MSENKQMLGEFIAERRKALGITQNQLAEKLGITGKAVSKWETLDANPDISLLIPLASILQVTTDELLRGELNSPDSVSAAYSSDGMQQPFAAADSSAQNSGIVKRILLSVAGVILALFAIGFLLSFLITLIGTAEELEVTRTELIVFSVFSVVFLIIFALLSTLCFLKAGSGLLPAGFTRWRDLSREDRVALIRQFNREYRGILIAYFILLAIALSVLLAWMLLFDSLPETGEKLLRAGGTVGILAANILSIVLINKKRAWFARRKIKI